jgi:predicted metalloprotease
MANWGKILGRGKVDDRRSMAPVAGGVGVTGLALYLLVTFLSGGEVNVSDVLTQLESVPVPQQQNATTDEFTGDDSYQVFASTVLGSNNEMWHALFRETQKTYVEPTLVLFRTATASACGSATSSIGPHYCPLDSTIYLDETFFDELTSRFGAKGGDVAEAYVIAHEVAHHAQNQLGIMDKMQQVGHDNESSIRLELQADCFAGLWANSIKDLEVFLPGEIHEAMDAAAAVGDDRIQEKVSGQINSESWTHGSSTQRVAWFNKGYESGNLAACDAFNENS